MTQEQTLADSQTPTTSVADPLYLHLAITDPEVLAAYLGVVEEEC